MSYALSTTKRKFHRILDSISNASDPNLSRSEKNASSTSLSSTALDSSPAKKFRRERPASAFVMSTAQTASKNFVPSRSSLHIPAPVVDEQARMKPPTFTPWDRGLFLERLKTFRHVDKWMSKPESVSEVQWAKRGWTCVGKERVKCVACGKEVVVKLEDEDRPAVNGEAEEEVEEWRDDAQDKLAKRYAEMIITEHGESCLWRKRGCDETIYRLPLTHPQSTLDSLRHRYESLASMSAELPTSLTTPEAFDVDTLSQQASLLLQSRTSDESESATPPEPLNNQALTLALFGWQAEENHISGLATCNACFRRLGLWLFKKKPSTDSSNETEQAIMDRLDVIGEHREYCPWINASSQSGGATMKKNEEVTVELAGWEMLLKLMGNQWLSKKPEAVVSAEPIAQDASVGEESSIASIATGTVEPGDSEARDRKDKERWARLKKLKQVFHVKSSKNLKGKENSGLSVRSSTSTSK